MGFGVILTILNNRSEEWPLKVLLLKFKSFLVRQLLGHLMDLTHIKGVKDTEWSIPKSDMEIPINFIPQGFPWNN